MHAQKMPPSDQKDPQHAQSVEMKVNGGEHQHIKPLTPMRIIVFLAEPLLPRQPLGIANRTKPAKRRSTGTQHAPSDRPM